MSKGSEGQPPQPTRSLKAFNILVGEWNMTGTHPQLPATLHGHSVFQWLREGALLSWHFNWEPGTGVPDAYSIIGHDDAVEPCVMLYTDERGVTRIYQMSLDGGVWKMWRNSPFQVMVLPSSLNVPVMRWEKSGELRHIFHTPPSKLI
jgi:hypothetical protein